MENEIMVYNLLTLGSILSPRGSRPFRGLDFVMKQTPKKKPELFPKNNLREIRKRRGYESPAEFGALVGLSAAQIVRIENRTRRFRISVAQKCAKILHVTLQELCNAPTLGVEKQGIDPSTMNLALAAIYNACDNQSVNPNAEQMAQLVTEVYNDIVTINLDIHQVQLKAESLVSKLFVKAA
jgi:transcriptional regulator with XRE-family HTH domain